MKITFIFPSIGRKKGQKYIKSWQMEPLAIAQLASLTPKGNKLNFYDDRLEKINYDEPADLVAISVETYTARRAYQIASKFRRKNIPVIMGGFHVTLLPDEALEHADSILIGQAENEWVNVISDLENHSLKKIYKSDKQTNFTGIFPDRRIFKGKKYLSISLVETGRGCKFNCNFCSITNFYNHTFTPRPIKDIVKEIKNLEHKIVFFIDDNICADSSRSKELFKALVPLNIKWISQVSVNYAKDKEMVKLMKESGCLGVLIGFESLDRKSLDMMNKSWNNNAESYKEAIANLNEEGLILYGTFLFGYDYDTEKTIKATVDFAIKNKMFLSAFAHLMPFPGTPIYEKLKRENKLLYEKWWLDSNYHFFMVPFKPKKFSSKKLAELCLKSRKQFYSLKSILSRGCDFKANSSNPKSLMYYIAVNMLMRKEVNQRNNLPLGLQEDDS
jgi:radical SAM superfamily enzyme YgiQ (UPF0313 family)